MSTVGSAAAEEEAGVLGHGVDLTALIWQTTDQPAAPRCDDCLAPSRARRGAMAPPPLPTKVLVGGGSSSCVLSGSQVTMDYCDAHSDSDSDDYDSDSVTRN